MAHIAFVAPPLRGHLDPMNALGRVLVQRGHRVSVCLDRDSRDLIHPDLEHVPLDLPVGRQKVERDMSLATRPHSLLATIQNMALRTSALCAALPSLIRSMSLDAMISDQTEAAGALVAKALGIPDISLAAALPLNREDGVPPAHIGWNYGTESWRPGLNRGGYRVVDWLMSPLSRVISRNARQFGLGGITKLEDTFSERLQLFQCPAGFDYPRQQLSPAARYLGPLRLVSEAELDLEFDGRPLAFCSLGTIQGWRFAIFDAAAATAEQFGMQLVIAHYGRLNQTQVKQLSKRAVVREFVPQLLLLRRARLAILHAGLNSTLDALSCGVPVVAIPLAFEQAAIAARLKRSGAGLVVDHRRIHARLADACAAALQPGSMRTSAERLAQEIAEAGGVNRAADLVEQVVA